MTPSHPSNSDGIPAIPHVLVARLGESLTWRGICQWYTSPNRYLEGARPMDVDLDRALEAACAFNDGVYL